MHDAIYLVQNDGQLIEMIAQAYDSEALLQEHLASYPHLLAGQQINEAAPRRWLLVAREVGIPWEEGGGNQLSLDHLFLDQDAIPTLVEVKRSTDTRIRREVIGQMLEYAANAVAYWPIESLRARFVETCTLKRCDADQTLADFLDTTADDADAIEGFWQQAKQNLNAGRLRLLFVADEIPPQLHRIVEFLNTQMTDTEVLAIEIKQFVGAGLQTLVPRLLGQTAQAQQRKSAAVGKRQRWDEGTFFAALGERTGPTEVRIARQLLMWAQAQMPDVWWGLGKRDGSFVPGYTHRGKWYQLIGVWTNGYIELQFQYMKSRGALNDQQRQELLQRWRQIPGISLTDDSIERRPSIPLSVLANEDAWDKFSRALEWALTQIAAKDADETAT
ncbi:MAG TPA: hypothetical protein P5121_35140 [Caldilineaceae bacterium]|nr:hypothetical protein [Caldilineaceae bacterium]